MQSTYSFYTTPNQEEKKKPCRCFDQGLVLLAGIFLLLFLSFFLNSARSGDCSEPGRNIFFIFSIGAVGSRRCMASIRLGCTLIGYFGGNFPDPNGSPQSTLNIVTHAAHASGWWPQVHAKCVITRISPILHSGHFIFLFLLPRMKIVYHSFIFVSTNVYNFSDRLSRNPLEQIHGDSIH